MHESKIMPRERVIQQTVEEVVEISVPMTQGNIVLVPTVANHRGHHHVELEVIVEVLYVPVLAPVSYTHLTLPTSDLV